MCFEVGLSSGVRMWLKARRGLRSAEAARTACPSRVTGNQHHSPTLQSRHTVGGRVLFEKVSGTVQYVSGRVVISATFARGLFLRKRGVVGQLGVRIGEQSVVAHERRTPGWWLGGLFAAAPGIVLGALISLGLQDCLITDRRARGSYLPCGVWGIDPRIYGTA